MEEEDEEEARPVPAKPLIEEAAATAAAKALGLEKAAWSELWRWWEERFVTGVGE